MQSQQKRIKWSRGETAEALEERTDTGITQASVELMENCIPDIYGNISRRPGIKLVPQSRVPTYNYVWQTAVQNADLGNNGWNAVAYCPTSEIYVALSSTGYYSKSTDGETWESASNANAPGNNGWSKCIWNTDGAFLRSMFVAISNNGKIAAADTTGDWGQTVWSYVTLQNRYWTGIAAHDRKFVIIDRDGYISYYTSDMNDWVQPVQSDALGARYWQDIVYGNGKYVAISSVGYVAVSDDGINWSLVDVTATLGSRSWRSIIYTDGVFIALGSSGHLSYSQNGITWTVPVAETELGSQTWTSMAVGNNQYVAIGNTGYVSQAVKSAAITQGRMGFQYHKGLKVYPFYISENDYILCGFSPLNTEFIRIKNSEIVGYYELGALYSYVTNYDVSFAQQNNYAIVGTEGKTFVLKMTLNPNGVDFVPVLSTWDFTAGWYAPYGTQTKTVSTTQIPGVEFNHDTKGFQPYTYTAGDGSSTIYSYIDTNLADNAANRLNLTNAIPLGSILQFANNGAFFRVEGITSVSSTLKLYGSLLTAVADSSAKDQTVTVEYGYISLEPSTLGVPEYSWPRPTKFAFAEQRLWTGGWIIDNDVQYSLVVGSQIARYTDLKNDYNLENEPITLDIFTKYKEQILHLIDYNGLKIFTNSHEYAYQNGSAVKQSANGSLATCEPIVFESLCLYVDSTGNQVRAMQYEFQTNVYESSCINQVAPHDLIWFPVEMAQYEDKVNNTGKYLFVTNINSDEHPKLAVCNFVPSNQANIWSRWSTQTIEIDGNDVPIIFGVMNMKAEPIVLMVTKEYTSEDATLLAFVKPAMLDFTELADMMGTVVNNKFIIDSYTFIDYDNQEKTNYITLNGVTVNVYANGVFQWQDTLTATGEFTKDMSQLTNITVGLPVNSTIRSHPIDVGGKTKSVMKRIGKAQMSVHGTDAGAITINGKTGYMNPRIDHICFYGVTGMKDEIKYTITNNNGAMFHLESLLMNIEYGTLDS